MKLALVLLACSLHAQDLTQEEQWATVVALHLSGEVWTDKAPTEAELDAPAPAVFRLVESDRPLRVHTAAWQLPVVSPSVTVSFSGQGAEALRALTGKRIPGIQMVQGTVCSHGTGSVSVGAVIQEAHRQRFQTLLPSVGTAIVQRTVNLNWRNITMNVFRIATGTALMIFTGGTVTASAAVTSGVAYAHGFSDTLPLLFTGVPKPDPYLNSVADFNSKLELSGTPEMEDCRSILFTAVYGKSTPVLAGPVQLVP